MSEVDLDRFYNEPALDVLSESEEATEDVWRRTIEDAVWRHQDNQPMAPSRAEEDHPQNSPGTTSEQQPQQHIKPAECHYGHTSSNWVPTGSW